MCGSYLHVDWTFLCESYSCVKGKLTCDSYSHVQGTFMYSYIVTHVWRAHSCVAITRFALSKSVVPQCGCMVRVCQNI